MTLSSSYRNIAAALLCIVIAISCIGLASVDAQSICNVSLDNLVTCKPAVTQPNPTPPSKPCCTAISHADMKCLCSYKSSTMLPSLGIDPELAIQLPAKCHIRNAPKC